APVARASRDRQERRGDAAAVLAPAEQGQGLGEALGRAIEVLWATPRIAASGQIPDDKERGGNLMRQAKLAEQCQRLREERRRPPGVALPSLHVAQVIQHHGDSPLVAQLAQEDERLLEQRPGTIVLSALAGDRRDLA